MIEITENERVVVIGGGITGLATAALLARDGKRVTLLERGDAVGGRAGLRERDGFRFDAGPSWYLMPEVFDHFYKLLGTTSAEQLELTPLDPGYRVFFEGRGSDTLDIRSDREKSLALFDEIEPGAGKRMAEYLDSAADTYEMAKKRFLYTTFQSFLPLLRPDVLARTPKLLRLLAEPLSTFTKRYVEDPRLNQVLGYPAVFLGSSPYSTPSMYHLMSHLDLEDGVLYPQGGFVRLIETIAELARDEGVEIVTNADVTAILTAGGQSPAATGVAYVDADGEARTLNAEIVVSAADLHHTETQLLPPHLQTYPEKYWNKKTSGPGAVLLYLGVRGELPELLHHSLFFTEDWADNFGRIFGEPTSVPDPASIYVCRPSATDDTVAPEGHENLFVLIPIPADPSIGGAGDDRVRQIGDAAIRQIAEWAGIPDLEERIVVREEVGPADFERDLNSWKGGVLGPAHILSQSAFFRAGNVSKKVTGLYYAGGSSIPGIGLPMCLISAELVLKRVHGDTSTGPLPEPLIRRRQR